MPKVGRPINYQPYLKWDIPANTNMPKVGCPTLYLVFRLKYA